MFEGIVIVFVSVFALVLYFPQLLNVFFLADLNICSETGEGAGAGCRSCAELVGSDSEMPDLRTPPTLPTNARLIFRRHVKGGGKQGGGCQGCQVTVMASFRVESGASQLLASPIRPAIFKMGVLKK